MTTKEGLVIKSTGSTTTIQLLDTNEIINAKVRGKFRIKEGIKLTNPVAVGDKVLVEQRDDEISWITHIFERKNYIIRKAIAQSKEAQIIASNIDQVIIVATLAFPRTSSGFIDRIIITAEAYQIPILLVFNKADLFQDELAFLTEETEDFLAIYDKIGYATLHVSAASGIGLENLKAQIKDKTSLVIGHSGVGKSTLLNALNPNLELRTGEISEVHMKGKHTTTFAERIEMNPTTYLIDTPGIKEFGMVRMNTSEIKHYFKEFVKPAANCYFKDCLHLNEPKCAVKTLLEEEQIAESRYKNYISILETM